MAKHRYPPGRVVGFRVSRPEQPPITRWGRVLDCVPSEAGRLVTVRCIHTEAFLVTAAVEIHTIMPASYQR